MKKIQPKYAKSKENEHMNRLQQDLFCIFYKLSFVTNYKTNCKNTGD